jgi:hypothetical protein
VRQRVVCAVHRTATRRRSALSFPLPWIVLQQLPRPSHCERVKFANGVSNRRYCFSFIAKSGSFFWPTYHSQRSLSGSPLAAWPAALRSVVWRHLPHWSLVVPSARFGPKGGQPLSSLLPPAPTFLAVNVVSFLPTPSGLDIADFNPTSLVWQWRYVC